VRIRIIFLTAVSALLLHTVVGWAWSPVAAIAGGYRAQSNGWAVGAIGVGMSWTGLVFFNLFAAPAQVLEMARVVASITGGLPGWTVFLTSIIMGFLLGGLGGLLGQSMSEFKTKRNTN